MKEIAEAVGVLRPHHNILSPKDVEIANQTSAFVTLTCDTQGSAKDLQNAVLNEIDRSDLVYWVNPCGYVGASASFEVGYSVHSGVPVYCTDKPNDVTLPFYVQKWLSPSELLFELKAKDPSVINSNSALHLFFDLDDTLIHDQLPLQNAQLKITEILDRALRRKSNFAALFDAIEEDNIPALGYGYNSYFYSLCEAIQRLSPSQEVTIECRKIVASLMKQINEEPPQLIEGVKETLAVLQGKGFKLHVVTCGVEWQQRKKVIDAGLIHFFDSIDVVTQKNSSIFRRVLTKYSIDPIHACMIGNGIKSDINSALLAGMGAIYVPAPIPWSHEQEETIQQGYISVNKFADLQLLFHGGDAVWQVWEKMGCGSVLNLELLFPLKLFK